MDGVNQGQKGVPSEDSQRPPTLPRPVATTNIPLIPGATVLIWHHRFFQELNLLLHDEVARHNITTAYEIVAAAFSYFDSRCILGSATSCANVNSPCCLDKADPRTGAVPPPIPAREHFLLDDPPMLRDVCEQRKAVVLYIIHRNLHNLSKQSRTSFDEEVSTWIEFHAMPTLERAIGE